MHDMVHAITMYAMENNDELADMSNFSHAYDSVVLKNPFYVAQFGSGTTNSEYTFTPQRIHPAVREMFTDTYGTPREYYYCPSNARLNKDWWWGPQTSASEGYTTTFKMPMTGFMFLAGRREFAFRMPDIADTSARGAAAASGMSSGSIYRDIRSNGSLGAGGGFGGDALAGFEWVPAGQRVMKRKLSDSSYFNVAVTDLCYSDMVAAEGMDRQWFGNRPGRPETQLNHIAAQPAPADGFIPPGKGGINYGSLDGSVEWRHQGELGQPAAGRGLRPNARLGYKLQYRWLELTFVNSKYRWFW